MDAEKNNLALRLFVISSSVAFQGKIIVLESLTPVLPPKEKEQRRKEIERCLYEVFSKYGDRFP